MDAVFIKLLNMSIAANFLVFAVVLLRIVLKKAPKTFRCVMWLLVAVRLICPFSFESGISLIPSAETITQDVVHNTSTKIKTGFASLNNAVNSIVTQGGSDGAAGNAKILQMVTFISSVVWIVGAVVMLIYAFISILRIFHKVCEAIPLKDNIKICDNIGTPFILGIVRPHIYLPSSVNESDMEFVIAHENAHLRHFDHLWKPFGFLLLTVYWFNPIMWLAYILFCRDIELACDERVLKGYGAEIKKSYSTALINCSVHSSTVAVCPLAFGEIGVKERVKTVLNYKKPAFWVIAVCIVTSIALAFCFLTNPISGERNTEKIDISDIETINIGSEVPWLMYGDDNKVIFSGTCGIIVYNLNICKITERLSYNYLNEHGIEILNAYASTDGNTVYIGDLIEIQDGGNSFNYKYDLNTRILTEYDGHPVDTFSRRGYDYTHEKYGKYFDKQKLIGSFTIERKDNFIYLQAEPDWSMKSLQIVICDYNNENKKIIDVFS